MKIRIRIDIQPIIEEVEIDDWLLEHLSHTPEVYAHNVAQERFADMLRDGDPFHKLYEKASFTTHFMGD